MRYEELGRAVAWAAGGTAVLSVGVVLGAVIGRPRRRPAAGQFLEWDLDDRPVAHAAWMDALAAAQRVADLSDSVATLEERVGTLERHSAAGHQQSPGFELLLEELQKRLFSQLGVLEARAEKHHAAIAQLQAQARRTDSSLQLMISAVETLTKQIFPLTAKPAGPPQAEVEKAASAC